VLLKLLALYFFVSFPTTLNDHFFLNNYFISGVQYRISEETGNCTLEGIPLDAPDAALTSATKHVRLRHAQELLHADRDSFAYWGLVCNFIFKMIHHFKT
jgi:hypothetical protein